jgi:Concanavalin A-like lectin/glucanases superfamily
MSSNNSATPVAKLIPYLIVFAGLIVLYFLYQYLFGPKTQNVSALIPIMQNANIDSAKPIIITSDKLPTLYEGGEFTVSTWIYINNWSYRQGFAKHIISVGGRNFDTFRIYLGGRKPKLNIRFHTKEGSAVSNGVGNGNTDSLDAATQNATYNVIENDSMLLGSNQICDLPEVDLQRWVNLTVAVNGKTVDVYLDGKLSRSCVLPSYYKVDAGGYSATLLNYGGFGGQITTTNMYDAALNPDTVYKNYMAGPSPITTLSGWFSNFFAPGVSIAVSTN